MRNKKIGWILLLSLLLVVPSVLGDIVLSCSPTTVAPSSTVACVVSLTLTPISVSSIEFTVQPGTLFSVQSVTNFPIGFTGSFNPSTGQVAIVTGNFGERPTTLATLNLIAGSTTGAGTVTLSSVAILDDQFNQINYGLVRLAALTVGSVPCGDGVISGTEQCDDSNAISGDGCSSACSTEGGFTCAGTPSVCTKAVLCGDGIISGTEVCDDSNILSNDGCSATCIREAGYSCTGLPSSCTAVCGDSLRVGAETCDDGNIVGNDGCSVSCTQESGYTCDTMTPNVCTRTAVCGNNIREGTEQCDDSNAISGDGCSSACLIEGGFTCAGIPSVCSKLCGDRIISGTEVCDDGNILSNDGCSATCLIEVGYSCTGQPSVCTALPVTCGVTTLIRGSAVTIPLTCLLENLRTILEDNVEYPTKLQKISAIARELARYI